MTVFRARWSPQQTLLKVVLSCREDYSLLLIVEQHAVDDETKWFSKPCVTQATSLRAKNRFPFSEANFEVQDILYYERGGNSDREFTRDLISVDVQLMGDY